MRFSRSAALAAGLVMLTSALPAPASAVTGDLSAGATQPVIVVLKDQHPDVPVTKGDTAHRHALTQSDQQPLIDQAKQTGAENVTQFSLVNGFAAKLTTAEQQHLAGDPRVQAVYPDRVVRTPPPALAAASRAGASTGPAGPSGPSGACPADPAKPLLEPEALQATHVASTNPSDAQAASLATGRGVTVAFLADGIDVTNPDLVRPDGSKVITDYQDFAGHGPNAPEDDREAFGDASAIAAQGRQTYDLSDYAAPGSLPKGCTVRIRGVAPDASLVAMKVVSNGFGLVSAIVQALDYAVNVDKVDVINESFSLNAFPDDNTDPISLADRAAIAAGVTIVASSGDGGINGTVGSPASDPAVIAAGASTTFRLYAQLFPNLPGFTGTWVNDNVSAMSSGGATQRGRVVDLLAPGDEGWALCSTDNKTHTGCTGPRRAGSPVQEFGGTSQAAPLIAGAAALVIQAYERTHHGVRPSPQLVKQILTSTATDNLDPSDRQGAGLLNAYEAVRAALSIRDGNGATTAQGEHLIVNQTQLLATGTAGQPQAKDLTVTNDGATTQTVSAHTRALTTPLSDEHGSVTLDATSPATPTWTDGEGGKGAYVTRTFTVPSGADHLDASLAYPTASGRGVFMWLLDPSGTFSGFSFGQGLAGFGHIDVHSPTPGTWTAVMDATASATGFKGTVSVEFATTKNATLGAVLPAALTLRPGQSGTFHVLVSTPANPGDLAAAVELDGSAGTRLAVPMVLRTTLPRSGGSFSGTLTGGNGRAGSPAQTTVYRFDVPRGQHDLGVGITLDGDPHQVVTGYLISPDGQLLSQQNNVLSFNANGAPTAYGQSVQVYRRDPAPGEWTLVLGVDNPVAGTATSQHFSGTLRYNVVDAQVSGLPHVLPAGKPTTVAVRVRNTGQAALSYFVDGRSTACDDLRLLPLNQAATVPLPQSTSTRFLVPAETTALTASASASEPIDLRLVASTGLPQLLGRSGAGDVAVTSVTSPQVTPGNWWARVSQIGPFPGPSKPGTATISATAHTPAFDPAVTSSTGDFWLAAAQATPPAFTPLVLQPGQSGTITVTITPTAPKGATVTGVLYLDDYNQYANASDSLKAFPYSYTVE